MSDDRIESAAAARVVLAAQAAQRLSDLLWEALREELVDPRPERVAELSERLVSVAGVVGALSRSAEPRADFAASLGERLGPVHADFSPAPSVRASERRGASTAVLVDEHSGPGDVESRSPRARRRPATIEDLL